MKMMKSLSALCILGSAAHIFGQGDVEKAMNKALACGTKIIESQYCAATNINSAANGAKFVDRAMRHNTQENPAKYLKDLAHECKRLFEGI